MGERGQRMAAAVAAALVGLLAGSRPAASEGASDVLLILDASGSMWGRVAGEPKIAIARRVLKDLAGNIPAGAAVGLVAYGHRSEGDCNDIETVMAIAPLDAAAFGARADALNAKGKTPITRAVEHAAAALKTRARAATVILVSDGIETCGGDPCAAVRAAKAAGITFVLHVVGFDLGDADVSQLECAAQAGGGLYFDARNADELAGALDQALAAPAPEERAARLSVAATADGKPIDATVLVTAPGASEPAAAGRTYADARTNPKAFELSPGAYEVDVAPVKPAGAAKQTVAVTIEAGAVAAQVLAFP